MLFQNFVSIRYYTSKVVWPYKLTMQTILPVWSDRVHYGVQLLRLITCLLQWPTGSAWTFKFPAKDLGTCTWLPFFRYRYRVNLASPIYTERIDSGTWFFIWRTLLELEPVMARTKDTWWELLEAGSLVLFSTISSSRSQGECLWVLSSPPTLIRTEFILAATVKKYRKWRKKLFQH